MVYGMILALSEAARVPEEAARSAASRPVLRALRVYYTFRSNDEYIVVNFYMYQYTVHIT